MNIMGCDYYTIKDLIIEYMDEKNETILEHIAEIERENRYIYHWDDYDSDDDHETEHEKYKNEIYKIMQNTESNKILFENKCWIKLSYQKKYNFYLQHIDIQEDKLIKITVHTYATERS